MTGLQSANESQDCQAALLAFAKDYAEALSTLLGDRLVSVVLFGSVARREAGRFSDIDLLIVSDTLPKGRFARKAVLGGLDRMAEERLAELEARG